MWYRFLENAFDKDAKDWVEGTQSREPGQTAIALAYRTGDEDAWANVYRLARQS